METGRSGQHWEEHFVAGSQLQTMRMVRLKYSRWSARPKSTNEFIKLRRTVPSGRSGRIWGEIVARRWAGAEIKMGGWKCLRCGRTRIQSPTSGKIVRVEAGRIGPI